MTEQHVINPLSTGVYYQALTERFRPIFERIAEGAVEREQTRALPREPIQWLKEAGFGAVRVPVEYGGGGASLPQLFELLIELAEADSNVPQALRGHFAFAEDRLNAPPGAGRDLWFKRFVDGDIVGCAWTEIGSVAIGDVITKVSQDAQIQQVVGEVTALVYAAEASALKATIPAQRAYLARFGGDDALEREANVAAEIESATAQVVVSELIQRATSELFNALGASDIRKGQSLDRHWRNARTVSSHNPVIYKARIVGDWVINGTEPPFVWQIGNGPARG